VGEVTIMDAEGRITAGDGSVTLRTTGRDLISTGHKNLVLNMAGISYMDSSGIGELVSLLSHANQGGSLRLLSPSKRVRDLLDMTHVMTLFQVFTEEDAAVRSFDPA
jgi:anti-sigma B factor antagonist